MKGTKPKDIDLSSYTVADLAKLSPQQLEAFKAIADIKQLEDWRCHPLLWLKERLGEDPKELLWDKHEGYENHKWDGSENPMAQAWQTIADSYAQVANGELPSYKNVAIESGTGTGKTYWLARLIVWYLDCWHNSLVITSAPSDNQLKMGLWAEISRIYPRIKKFRPNAKKWQLRLAMDWQVQEWMTEDEKLELEANAWHAKGFVTGTSSNKESEDKARGFHRENMLIVLEETTGIPMPIITAFQNTCTGRKNFIVGVGNPNNEFDALHQFAIQKDTKHIIASSLDHPNIVLQQEMYAGAITQSSINSRIDNYGEDSPIYKAMVRGQSPAQATDSLIKMEWVEACLNTDHKADACDNAVGIDVANSVAGDKAAIAAGKENTLTDVQEFQCDNATHLAYNLFMDSTELATKGYGDYGTIKLKDKKIDDQFIGVDAVGVGVATINAFKDHSFSVQSLQGGQWAEVIPLTEHWEGGVKKEVPMYKFQNLRGQMYWELREDIRLERININLGGDDKLAAAQLVKELCIPKYSTDKGVIKIEGKDDIKKRLGGKSPNVADAIVYWNWTRKGHRAVRRGFPAMFGGG